VPKRRNEPSGLAARAANLAAGLMFSLWAKATRRPVDTVALLAAVAASTMIAVNALFLQSGSLPTPFMVTAPAPANGATPLPEPRKVPPMQQSEVAPAPQHISARNDPIAQLIGRSSRIIAIQRALSNYGYGQIRVTGVLDRPTTAAIERFERQHDLPVTGRISDRLVSELSVLVGHPIE